MYLGRIVSVGLTLENKMTLMYRVSSRSFPNRIIRKINGALAVIPASGFETDIYQNPYISYNCLRADQQYAVVGNGTHTDPVFEKLQSGMSMRDALCSVLFAMDYEHDSLNTPRIAAIADRGNTTAALGVVRPQGIEVQEFSLQPGCYRYISTYEHCFINDNYAGSGLQLTSATQASEFILSSGVFSEFSHPVAAAAAFETDDGFSFSQ